MSDPSKLGLKALPPGTKKRREDALRQSSNPHGRPTSPPASGSGGAPSSSSVVPKPREIAPLPDQTREYVERKLEKKLSLSDITFRERETSNSRPSTARRQSSSPELDGFDPNDPTTWPGGASSSASPLSPVHLQQIELALRDHSHDLLARVAQRTAAETVASWLNTRGPEIFHEWLSNNMERLVAFELTGENKRRRQDLEQKFQSPPRSGSRSSEVSEEGTGSGMEDDAMSNSPQRQQGRPIKLGRQGSFSPEPIGEDGEVDPRLLVRQRMMGEQAQAQQSAAHKGPVQSLIQNAQGFIEPGDLQQGPNAHSNALAGSDPLARPSRPKKSSSSASSPDVLLVEDVKVSQKLFHALLTRAQYKVEVASDGETAVDVYQREHHSLRAILMDIHMPGINGMEATQRIRRIEAELGLPPVLVYGLTGDVSEENLREYEQAGMNGCIVKGKLLVEALKEAMEQSDREPSKFVNLAGTPTTTAKPASQSASRTPRATSSNSDDEMMHNSPSSSPMRSDSPGPAPAQAAVPRPRPAQSTSGSIPIPRLTLPYVPGSFGGPEILLVEDVRVSQRIAKSSLERSNFKVEVASSGEEAIQKYRAHSNTIRVILMDIGLPGMSGIEATEAIRTLERENRDGPGPILIFGLTGNTEEQNMREYEQVGMNGCIAKGKTISEAVKQGIEASVRNPGVFVNLAAESDSPNTGLSPAQPAPRVGLSSAAPVQQQDTPMDSSSPVRFDQTQLVNERLAGLRESDSYAESGIGTPRAPQPRQLLNAKFPGRGTVKPGIGLPHAAAVSPPQSAVGLSRSLAQQASANGPNVLLVEDVKVSQKIAQTTLTRAQYKVEVASDGEEAIRKFEQHYPSLRVILMDVGLPGKSGVEATVEIRDAERRLRDSGQLSHSIFIFGLTGNVDTENLKLYERAGMNGCIVKGKLLVEAVKRAVEQVEFNPAGFVNLSGDEQ